MINSSGFSGRSCAIRRSTATATVAQPLPRKVTAIPRVAIFSRLGVFSPFWTSRNLQATINELTAPRIPSNALAKMDELSVELDASKETTLKMTVTKNDPTHTANAALLHFSRNFCGTKKSSWDLSSSKYDTQCLSFSGCLSSSSSVNASIVTLLWEPGELLQLAIFINSSILRK